MRIIDWNISYAGNVKSKIEYLKTLLTESYCIILQEVTGSSYIELKKSLCNCTFLYSLF